LARRVQDVPFNAIGTNFNQVHDLLIMLERPITSTSNTGQVPRGYGAVSGGLRGVQIVKQVLLEPGHV
jgi:hypothetical protein